MAEEFEGELVCGGNWWNSSKNLFSLSPCSPAIDARGSFAWPDQGDDVVMDVKTMRSSDNSAGSCASDGSSISSSFAQSVERSQLDSTLQMMGINFPSSDDWNQDFLHDSGRLDENYSHVIDQEPRGLNPTMNNQQGPLNSMMNSPTHLPLNSASNSHTSSLLQTLIDADSDQPEHSLLDNQRLDFPSAMNSQMNNSTELFSTTLTKASSIVEPFWNATTSASGDVRASFVPSSTQSPIYPASLSNAKRHGVEARDVASIAKNLSSEPALIKRPRLETPSPLPTFKVRKEKLGDRITALQQLVSPFGKTDTASVLHEATDYIKFLHDQVNVLSTPYMKNGPPPMHNLKGADKIKDQELVKAQDLKSRGLCLMPISSTFPVTSEIIATDFWPTPALGGASGRERDVY